MKCVIAGSRHIPTLDLNKPGDWWDQDKRVKIYTLLEQAIKDSGFHITLVISGTCWGIDQLGESWALDHGVPVLPMPAEWNKFHKAAGPIRNAKMADIGECLICLCMSDSRGSLNMIDCMRKLNKPVFSKFL